MTVTRIRIFEAHAKHVAEDAVVTLTTMWGRLVVHFNFIHEFMPFVMYPPSSPSMNCSALYLFASFFIFIYEYPSVSLWHIFLGGAPFCATQIDEPVGNFHTEN